MFTVYTLIGSEVEMRLQVDAVRGVEWSEALHLQICFLSLPTLPKKETFSHTHRLDHFQFSFLSLSLRKGPNCTLMNYNEVSVWHCHWDRRRRREELILLSKLYKLSAYYLIVGDAIFFQFRCDITESKDDVKLQLDLADWWSHRKKINAMKCFANFWIRDAAKRRVKNRKPAKKSSKEWVKW